MSQTRNPEKVYYPGTQGYDGVALPTTSSKKPEKDIYIKQVLDWVILQLSFTTVITFYSYMNSRLYDITWWQRVIQCTVIQYGTD